MPSFSTIRPTLVALGIFVCVVSINLGSSSQFYEEANPVPGSAARQPAETAAAAPASTVSVSTVPVSTVSVSTGTRAYRLFPSLLRDSSLASRPVAAPRHFGPALPPEAKASALSASALSASAVSASAVPANAVPGPDGSGAVLARTAVATAERQPLLAGNQVLAFYGKPGAASMGILGEYPKEQLAPLLEAYARLYDEANGDLGIVPAFYLIYGTVWPEGEIGLLNRSVIEAYIEFAAERGWQVFLDHQLGKYDVESSVRSMLPFLAYPNVHLAIDPEWRTLKPMKEIGYITGAELNAAQKLVDDYLRDNGLPGVRMLMVHQFKPTMIIDAASVRADFDRVVLVHTADGFGSPSLKKNTYAGNARSLNMPVKGFKLFFESKVAGAGWDKPLMRPEEVLALDPMPLVVMYQ